MVDKIWFYSLGEAEDSIAYERETGNQSPINISSIVETTISHDENIMPEQIINYELPRKGAQEFLDNLPWLIGLIETTGALTKPYAKAKLDFSKQSARNYLKS